MAGVLRLRSRQPRGADRPPHAQQGVPRELQARDEPGRSLLVPLGAALDAGHLLRGHEVRYHNLAVGGETSVQDGRGGEGEERRAGRGWTGKELPGVEELS